MYTHPLTRESAPEGSNLLVDSSGSGCKPTENWASSIVLSQTPLPHTVPHRSDELLHPGEYLRLPPLLGNRIAQTEKKIAQMKEHIKGPEKIWLSNEEIDNLSDAQFKTLAIRMLTELVEHCHKIEEKVKGMKSETKENVQRTNSEGKENGTQVNYLDQKEEIKSQPE